MIDKEWILKENYWYLYRKDSGRILDWVQNKENTVEAFFRGRSLNEPISLGWYVSVELAKIAIEQAWVHWEADQRVREELEKTVLKNIPKPTKKTLRQRFAEWVNWIPNGTIR